VSSNKVQKENAVFLATQARDDAPHYQHSKIGHNYRMSNVLAGIGRGQMKVLDERVDSRRRNYDYYHEQLQGMENMTFLPEPKEMVSNRWLSCVLLDSYELREKIRIALLEENIESRPLWKPMHLQPIFKNDLSFTDGTSEDLFKRGLCLPSGSNLSLNDLKRVTQIIKFTLG
jgi:dTDP-4-amino-4,6-dideoxygalactose transaminase